MRDLASKHRPIAATDENHPLSAATRGRKIARGQRGDFQRECHHMSGNEDPRAQTVPLSALHACRRQNQKLRARIAELERANVTASSVAACTTTSGVLLSQVPHPP